MNPDIENTHEEDDILITSALRFDVHNGQDRFDRAVLLREKLGIDHDDVRRFEQHALAVLKQFPDATVERTRDAIQINVQDINTQDGRGIVLLLTPGALELRLPTVEWTHGAYGPRASSKLWRRVVWDKVSTPTKLHSLCYEALRTRAAEFMRCRFCGQEFPPEHRHSDDVCHGCAERELQIVH